MLTVCEAVAQFVMPTVRALVTKSLIEAHGLTQKEAARRLGITQPAVSQYKKHVRGNRVSAIEKHKTISEKISALSLNIARGDINEEEATIRLHAISKEIVSAGILDVPMPKINCGVC